MRVYFDANILIAAFEDRTIVRDQIWQVLSAVESRKLAASTSGITLAEVLPKPLSLNQPELVQAYEHLLTSAGFFEVVAVGPEVLGLAARIRADRLTTKLPDAIHLATARLVGCRAISTGDKRLGLSAGVPVVAPGPNCFDQLRSAKL